MIFFFFLEINAKILVETVELKECIILTFLVKFIIENKENSSLSNSNLPNLMKILQVLEEIYILHLKKLRVREARRGTTELFKRT